MTALYKNYETTLRIWRESNRAEQPVMAIVMNSVKNANTMYRHIASGAVTPLLGNYADQLKGEMPPDPHTIIVHSKMEEGEAASGETGRHIRDLAEVYRRNPKYNFSDSDKPEEIIRRVMNTVGRDNEPGENVRCVISVNMLTEGWNTKTVSHLLGFRKFGSSLLCEQVAGRTLRRITRTKEDDGIRFMPEYAQILGILFPKYEEPTQDKTKDRLEKFPQVTVEPEPPRGHLRVEWPNIVQLQRAVPSAIAPWQHTGLLREYDIALNPQRVYGPTAKSEITYADCDSGWEVELARHLDEMPEITRWARNKGLNWSIPYVADRQQRRYWPDFVAVVPIDPDMELNIVIETKGLVRENDPIKRRWAQEYWIPAVNRHPQYGRATGRIWSYLYLDNEALVLQAKERIHEVIEKAKKG